MLLGAAFLVAVVATGLVRGFARRVGMVARPRSDRWHKKPTALLGGVAIFATVLAFVVATAPHPPKTWAVLGASAFLWLLGLLDDILHLKPFQKLVGQVLGAAIVIYADLTLNWTIFPLVNLALTVMWLVGITNAINLLDNMDGLAAGISTIASVFLAVNLLQHGQPADAYLLGILAAALLGFLVHNTHPASIFMGDCGSMFIGFFLASCALLDDHAGRARGLLPVLAVPALVLVIPIFDVTLVTIVRKLSGRGVAQGGRDHSSHRLVALGLSELRAVLLLYSLAAVAGLLALVVRNLAVDVALAVIACFSLVLTLLGVYLAGVKVYDETEVKAAREKMLVAFLIDLSYKRRVFEILLDLALIVLAFYGAHILVFGAPMHDDHWTLFVEAVPVLLFVKMATFLLSGVYSGLWRYIGMTNIVQYARAVVIGSVLSALALLLLFRFQGYSRTVFAVDAVVLFGLMLATRLAFRVFRSLLPRNHPVNGRRVLIYGAGDGGELLLREIYNNQALQYVPVGFADDDPLKKGKVIHGLRVLGGNGSLASICQDMRVDEVIISGRTFSARRVEEVRQTCNRAKVTLKRMRLVIEPLQPNEAE
jgi:UDP-GlcNAc:undecaprenyl-phosphate GlcNAc-1-phosphate transferase